jgi:chromosome segregation ATPase
VRHEAKLVEVRTLQEDAEEKLNGLLQRTSASGAELSQVQSEVANFEQQLASLQRSSDELHQQIQQVIDRRSAILADLRRSREAKAFVGAELDTARAELRRIKSEASALASPAP